MGLIRFFLVALFILMTGQALACTGACSDAGAVQFCTGTLKYCNGTTWTDLPSEAASGTCATDGVVEYASNELKFCTSTAYKYPYCQSSPATDGACSLGGTIEYDAANTRMEFCNGTNWIQMVACAGGGGGGAVNTAYCWGSDGNGQLGNGSDSTANQTSASAIDTVTIASFTDISSYSTAATCGLTNTGKVYCWGNDGNGTLGNGALTGSAAAPGASVALPSGVTSWTSISVGSTGCAIADTGNAYCWGDDSTGQIGNGATTTTAQASPLIVTNPSGVTSWVDIDVGDAHNCGIANNNNVYCWGAAANGRLGNGTTTPTTTLPAIAVAFPGGVTSWTKVDAGRQHSCAIANTGDMYCWGNDGNGQLGNGATTTTDQSAPVLVTKTGSVTSWTHVSAGNNNSCGIANTGALYCWGNDASGQIGNGATTTTDQDAPAIVNNPSGVTAWTAVEQGRTTNTGNAGVCGIGNNGEMYCWGSDANGQIGNGATTTGNQTAPVIVTKPSGVTSWTKLTVSQSSACGIGNNGAAYCWGVDTQGASGNGPDLTADQTSPVAVEVPNITGWTSISAGNQLGCGVAVTSAAAYCWGTDGSGALGNGAIAGNAGSPTRVALPTVAVTGWTSYVAGAAHSCGIANTGNAYCAGVGTNGEIGNGTNTAANQIPAIVTNPSGVTSWTALATGGVSTASGFTCGLGNNGNAYCWGTGTSGQLGNGASSNQNTPVLVTNPFGVTSWTTISTGVNHACAIGNNGNHYCWGANTNGAFGNGGTSTSTVPTITNLPGGGVTSWTATSAGQNFTCAIANTGDTYCFGLGTSGQLGNSASSSQTAPVMVTKPSGVTSWTKIAAGRTFACGVGNNNSAYCWGTDASGELGNGATAGTQNTPSLVTFPSGITSWAAVSGSGVSNFNCAYGQ